MRRTVSGVAALTSAGPAVLPTPRCADVPHETPRPAHIHSLRLAKLTHPDQMSCLRCSTHPHTHTLSSGQMLKESDCTAKWVSPHSVPLEAVRAHVCDRSLAAADAAEAGIP